MCATTSLLPVPRSLLVLSPASAKATMATALTLDFGGGLEALFSGDKSMPVSVPATADTLGALVVWIKDHLIRSRHDMFVTGDTIRPGVLVLVNDVDWELHGTNAYRIQPNDRISFISTLHGG